MPEQLFGRKQNLFVVFTAFLVVLGGLIGVLLVLELGVEVYVAKRLHHVVVVEDEGPAHGVLRVVDLVLDFSQFRHCEIELALSHQDHALQHQSVDSQQL